MMGKFPFMFIPGFFVPLAVVLHAGLDLTNGPIDLVFVRNSETNEATCRDTLRASRG